MSGDDGRFSVNLKRLREGAGLTQRKLGALTGKTVTTISRLENGHAWSMETVFLLSEALKVDVSEFFRPIDKHEAETEQPAQPRVDTPQHKN